MNPLRLLLVDDHEVVLAGLRVILESQDGWQVCGEATTGREAVEKARQLQPDVVVMDFSLPGMNGVEATRQIRQLLPGTEVVILTMHESGTLTQEALAAGARGFVLKAEANSQLVAAVKRVAAHKLSYTRKAATLVLEATRQNNAHVESDASTLTEREREVLCLIAEGKRSKEIALALNVSVRTTEAHRNNIMRKLKLHGTADLVRYAIRTQLVNP